MNLHKVANYVWEQSIEIKFGNSNSWDQNTFMKEWYVSSHPGVWHKEASGLYWFIVMNKTIGDICKIETPNDLPDNARKIADTAKDVVRIFKVEDICTPDNKKGLVIYNGHEKNVFTRIRSHFALNNNQTGALGLGFNLRVKIFHVHLPMDDLEPHDQEYIRKLLKEKMGREAVESCWRFLYGIPILCKR